MNIEQFLKTDYCISYKAIDATEYDSYINIKYNFIIEDDYDTHVTIDKVLDVQYSCVIYNSTLKSIVNVKNSFHTDDYTKIVPGSYVGHKLYSHHTPHMNKIFTRGYIIESGIIS